MLHYDILVKRKENQTLHRAKIILHAQLLEVGNKQGGACEVNTLCSLQFEALCSEVFDASAILSHMYISLQLRKLANSYMNFWYTSRDPCNTPPPKVRPVFDINLLSLPPM